MYLLLEMVVFHCYVSLPDNINGVTKKKLRKFVGWKIHPQFLWPVGKNSAIDRGPKTTPQLDPLDLVEHNSPMLRWAMKSRGPFWECLLGIYTKKLVGGFKDFLFSSPIWGDDPIWLILFQFTPLSQKMQGKRSSDPVRMGVTIWLIFFRWVETTK